jgi:GT2 family glycosyltransferase
VRAQITAVIVTYDSAAVLPACLDALAREGVDMIVVDNASGDTSAAIAEAAGATVIRNAKNEGYGRAMNIGMRATVADASSDRRRERLSSGSAAAQGAHLPLLGGGTRPTLDANDHIDRAYCLLLNPDLVLEPGAVAKLVEAARAYPEAGMLAPRLVEPDGRLFFQPRSLLSPYLENERGADCVPEGDCCAPFLSGACLLVDRDFILGLGGFDENIFLFCEDNDLSRRAIEAGRSLVHVHDAVAKHVRGGSTAPKPGRIFKARWHMAWSAGYATRKFGLPDPSWRTLIVNAAKFCLAAMTGNRRLMERYGGSAAGAFASLTRKSALEREGLA